MIVRRVYSQEQIKKVMDAPINKRSIYHDHSRDGEWPIIDNIYYLGIFLESEIIGLFIGIKQSEIVIDAHCAMLPSYYSYTDEAYYLVKEWAIENTNFYKIVGQTPTYNRLAIKCNERNGFKREGVNTKSIMKNGILYDQIYFGLNLER